MASSIAPNIVTDGLVLYLDAANTKSYPGSGTTWTDIATSKTGLLINGPTFSNTTSPGIIFDGTNDYASFEKIDFKDEEFITDIAKVEEFYNARVVLEYKQNKEKLTKNFSSNSELIQFMEMDENDSIKYGNLIFYNFDVPELKQKFKERNL